MPKIKGASADLVIRDEVRPALETAKAVVRAHGEQRGVRFEHRTADHMSFRNADGTFSRICICPCDACWPPAGARCPDWNDSEV